MTLRLNPNTGQVLDDTTGKIYPDEQTARAALAAGQLAPQSDVPSTQQADPMAYNPTDGMSGPEKFFAGMGKSIYDTGRSIGNMMGMVSDEDLAESRRLDAPLMDTGAGMVGNMVGHTAQMMAPGGVVGAAGKAMSMPKVAAAGRAMMAPTTAKGAAAMSGGYAALQGGDAADVALSAAMGGAGQKVAQYVAQGVKGVTPYMKEVAAKARKHGAQLTPGAVTQNPALRQLEASMASHPATANRMHQMLDVNQSALNRVATQAIGESGDEITEHVLGSAHKRLGDTFKTIFKDKAVRLDDSFLDRLVAAESNYTRSITGRGDATHRHVIDYLLDEIGEGTISGSKYLSMRNELTKKANQLWGGSNSNPDLAMFIDDIVDMLDEAATTSLKGGDEMARYAAARTQWKNLKSVEANVKGKDLSGPKLANYLRRKQKSGFMYGKEQSALNDMARFADNYRGIVGDSGTATRQAVPAMMARMMGGGAAGYGAGLLGGMDPYGAALIGGALMGPGAAAAMRAGQGAYLSGPARALLTSQGLAGMGVPAGLLSPIQGAMTYAPVGMLESRKQ